MNAMTMRIAQAVLGAAVLTAAVVWLSGGCGDRIAPDDPVDASANAVATGESALVVEEETEIFESASGTILSARHTTVSSKILARIEEIPVRAGDVVEQGALVVRLDARDLAARRRAALEEREAARASLDLALSERDRIRGLHDKRIASQQELDRTVAAHRMAVAALERSEQALTDAEVGLSYSEIVAPVSGRVVDRLAEPGDTAAPGAPLLHIYDPGAMRLEAPVREGLATRLSSGQTLEVNVEAIDLVIDGVIDEIVAAAEPGARTFLVKVRLPDERRLFSGMFGRVRVPAGRMSRIVVPETAIEQIGQLRYATVVASDGSSSRRMVTTGPRLDAGRIEVLSGLAAGERVLVR